MCKVKLSATMLFSGPRLSFSKLKYLSRILNCSISSLISIDSSRHFSEFKRSIPKTSMGPNINLYSIRKYTSDNLPESPFGNVNLDAIVDGDEELLKKLKIIILEADVMRQEGFKVPSTISEEKWKELLDAPSKSQRSKLLAFWWLNEKKKESSKKKKEIKKLKREESLVELEEKRKTDHIYYGLGGSTILLRVYDSKIDHFHNSKLINAMMFGQNLVIDCSYDEHMNKKENSLCASQLMMLFADNRMKDEPFNIHFCNVNKEGDLFKKLHKHIPPMYDDSFPMNIHEKSYLELFPKDRLVYLTPHCRDDLQTFDHDDIYIIGAMVDKINNDPLSLGKAKSEKLRMAKLPLERYLDWGIGTKSLTINQMILILHELKATGDWKRALEHVPKRKIKNEYFEKRSGSRPRKNPLDFSRLLEIN